MRNILKFVNLLTIHFKNFSKKIVSLFKAHIEFSDWTAMHREYFDNPNDPRTSLLCCYLNRDTKNLPKNGIVTYIKFLNESIALLGKSSPPLKTKQISPVATTPLDEPVLPHPRENITPKYSRRMCKSSNCRSRALEAREYFGYCEICFGINVLNNQIDTSRKEVTKIHSELLFRIL